MTESLSVLAAAALVGAGLVTGLLFAFSTCVMAALGELPDELGQYAMQRINALIVNPLFLLLFLGTPALCVALLVGALPDSGAPGHGPLISGALLYLLGPFGITLTRNVPLNDGLARREAAEAPVAWPAYRTRWQRWNHLRTALGVLALVALAAGLAGLSPR